ncbi:hypothetical protein NE865_09221 [Phthorimaea operculella]|nr:hypothetical protein NE865_09221 [Phthorimaea operculella]
MSNDDDNDLYLSRSFAYENSSNDLRSYPRPIEFVANDVTTHDERKQTNKQTNLLREETPKWGIKRFFEKKLGKSRLETEVKLIPENQERNSRTKTSIVERDRPSNLVLDRERNYSFEPCTLSPPNRTLSPTMLMESHLNRENRVFGFKELPSSDENQKQNQIFAVIVPKAKPQDYSLIELQNAGNSDSAKHSMSSQSFIKSGHSESEDSTVKKRLSADNRIITGSGRSSRASINLELQYMENQEPFHNDSPFELNSDCSSSEDEQLMLLSENGGSKITMQTIPKPDDKKKYQNDVLKEYKNFDNEFSDPADKENLITGYSGDNPVYIAALNGEICTADLKLLNENEVRAKPPVKSLTIKRQHSLEQVSELFTSSGDINLLNPAGRVKTPGDLPAAVRRARRDRHQHKKTNRLSLYDDRMMFGNSL